MSTGNVYDQGDEIRVAGEWEDASGTPLDPAALFFKFREPDGTETTYEYGVDPELVRDSAGNYHVDLDANAAGVWRYRWYSTGVGQAAVEGWFEVEKGELV